MGINSADVAGPEFAAAVRSILPRSTAKDLGGVALVMETPGVLRLTSFYASMDLAAQGKWSDVVEVSGRMLRNFVKVDPPSVLHISFSSGQLKLGGTGVTASTLADAGLARQPKSIRIGAGRGLAGVRVR